MLLGGIEAGGTKFVFGIGNADGNLIEKHSCPTTTPLETMQIVLSYFQKHPIKALGIGSFGPIDLDPSSSTYGVITNTPKQAWINADILSFFKPLSIPISITTDVNIAALGEKTWGVGQETDNCLYLTIGTGIGGGSIINNQFIQGLSHQEMGHIIVNKHPLDKGQNICPYHPSCLEGFASGPSMEKRWGKPASQLPIDHEAWDIEAYYIAQALVNYILTLSPQKIILGGGIMQQRHLFPLIHHHTQKLLNKYISSHLIHNQIKDYIVPPILDEKAGLLGAIALAHTKL